MSSLATRPKRTPSRTVDARFAVSPNLIPSGCQSIVPEMLPLITLSSENIEQVVRTVPGGAANIQDIYPLTPPQEGMLFHHMLNERGDVYVSHGLLEIQSREQLDAFISALQQIIDRYDILRSAVLWEQLPSPLQVVYRNATLRVEELRLDANGDTLGQIQEWMRRPEHRKLELRQAPLTRLFIAPSANSTRWYALLQMHHLVCDAQSLQIVFAEMVACLSGRASTLAEPMQYRNYVAQTLTGAQSCDTEEFFCRKLGDIEEPTAPYGMLDVYAGDGQTYDSVQTVDPALALRLRVQARRQRVSVAALVHSAWGLVVSNTANRDDVVFGTVLFGRLQMTRISQRSVGMFLNTLPLRLRLNDITVHELVDRTHRELLDLLGVERSSLAVAQRCSRIAGSTPLFTTLINYRYHARDFETQLTNEAYGIRAFATMAETNYPITVAVDDLGEEFLLTAQTDRRIDAQRIVAYLHTALRSLVAALEQAPETPALALSILPDSERFELLERFNTTQADYPREKLIYQLFEEQVARTPHVVALVHGEQSLTYGELNQRANRLARYLREKGIGPDRLVGICVERSLEMVVGLLGILKAGGAYVPLDSAYPSERLRYMLEDAAPRVVLINERCRASLAQTAAEIVALDTQWREIEKASSDNLELTDVGVRPDHLAYVIYTSGSTGLPKGVMIEHAAIVNFLTSLQKTPGLCASDCLLAVTTISFDIAGLEIYLPLMTGAQVVLAGRAAAADAAALMHLMESYNVSVMQATPTTWQLLLSGGWHGKAGLRALCGGEALTSDLSTTLLAHVAQLWNLYGPTETTIWSCTHRVTAPKVQANYIQPVGLPIANTRIYILDHSGQPVPIGVAGEIHIGGAGVARGYWNRPELTAQRFVPDLIATQSTTQSRMYKTGDLGRWRPDGSIEYIGRSDQQVKIRGFRIELGEIESQLTTHPRVRQATVLAREDAPGDKRLVAYVTTRDSSAANGTLSAESLRTHLKAALPDHMIPSAFVMLQDFPVTPNGKLDRRALPAPELGAYVSRQYEAPQGEVEEVLAGIWQSMLHLERVGRHDNFFELGGHSLLGMKVIEKVAQSLEIQAPLSTVFQYPTIRQMADLIETLLLSAPQQYGSLHPVLQSGAL